MARRRKALVGIVTALIVVFGWVGVLIALQLWSSGGGHSFRTETENLLERLDDPANIDAVYDDASPEFRKLVIREAFEEMVEDMHATLGEFQAVVATEETEVIERPGGKTARVKARVRFEEGVTSGNFSFHRIDARWRLLGISVNLPEGTSMPTPTGEALRGRVEAPPEVIDRVERIFESIREGEGGSVHDRAAPTFRESIERDKFLDFLENRRQAMGGLVRVLDIVKSKQHPNKNRATVVAVLEYGETRTTGTLDFVKVGDQWRLAGLKIIVPEPLVPEMPTGAPERAE